jgi:hypothetical protein
LRDVLEEEATTNPSKETYTRGILLSMWPERQDENMEYGIHITVDELVKIVRVMLTLDELQTFQKALKRLVMQFQEQWRVIQHAIQKLEMTLDYFPSVEHPWRVFDVHVAGAKERKHTPMGVSTSNTEDDFVVIPRLFLVEAEALSAPIIPGGVLRKADLDAAKDECRSSIPAGLSTRAPSKRHRKRPSRGMSGTGNAVYDPRNDVPFLNQAPGASIS